MKMKKATFITVLLCTSLTLGGCGSSIDTSSLLSTEAFYEECEIDRQQMSNIEDMIDGLDMQDISNKLDTIIANQDSLAEMMNETSVNEAPSTQTPAPVATPAVQEQEPTTSTPVVTVIYHKKLLDVPVSPKPKLTPFKLNPGEKDRDLNVTIQGPITKINLVDENGYYLGNIKFQSLNNMNYFYFNMENDGGGAQFYFEIIIDDNNQYYFGVDYT